MDKKRLNRYSRHIALDQIGLSGQITLSESVVTVVGAGGLGSPALLYLAAAGVGEIRIIDHDEVDLSNLQRQILHSERAVGRKKIDSADERLKEIDQEIIIKKYPIRLDGKNATELLLGSDVVVDGTDNFDARYAINDACAEIGVPWVFASVLRFEGQVSVFNYTGGPNYRDLFPTAPPPEMSPNCAEAGVLGSVTGIIGSIQATEAIKIILRQEGVLSGKLLILDALNMHSRILKIDYVEAAGIEEKPVEIGKVTTPRELDLKFKAGEAVFLLDVRKPQEELIATIPGTSMRIDHLQVPSRLDELPSDIPIIVYCHSGIRSGMIVRYLSNIQRFENKVSNLKGGIDLWSREIDSTIPRY